MSANTVERLHTAVVALAAERGIDGTSVDDIAARAGVAKGTVYYNFASKDDLVSSALTTGLRRFRERLQAEREVEGMPDPLAHVVPVIVAAVADHPDFAQLILAEGWRVGRPWYAASRAERDALVDDIAACADASKQHGRLSADFDTHATARALLATVFVESLDAVADGRTSAAQRTKLAARLLQLFDVARRV